MRIGAAAKLNGMSYNQFIHGLKVAGIELDRKILADLAVNDPAGFAGLASQAKTCAARRLLSLGQLSANWNRSGARCVASILTTHQDVVIPSRPQTRASAERTCEESAVWSWWESSRFLRRCRLGMTRFNAPRNHKA